MKTQAIPRDANGPMAARKLKPRGHRRLRSILSLDDFEGAARRFLPRPVFGYVAGAVEDEVSLRANRDDLKAIAFAPRVLGGHVERDLRTTLMGREYALPFGIAPMGLSALAAYDGDVVLAATAAELGIPAVMSSTSLTRLERVAEETGSRWFQAYLPGDDARIEGMLERVEAAGYDTLVVTADVPVPGNRENNVRNGFEVPMRPTPRLAWQGLTHPEWLIATAFRTLMKRGMPHFESMDVERGPPILSRNVERALGGRESLSWCHLDLVRRRWSGKLVLKGVLTGEDARMAEAAGCDGVVVSNHGGRQLDGAVSSAKALPDVVANAGRMSVMFDSGVRRGTDIAKILSLGADFVFVGRPFLFAAAIAGRQGVLHCARLLSTELDRNLAMLGVASVRQLSKELLRP